MSIILLLAPFLLVPHMTARAHGGASLLMLGACLAFVHGFGMAPSPLWGRIVFSPWAAWPLMGTGFFLLA